MCCLKYKRLDLNRDREQNLKQNFKIIVRKIVAIIQNQN